MPSKSPVSPRKRPTHQRAKVTVDAILQAAARLLEAGGFARLTTNHVAEAAGVSIGSLYQYFPNKAAICHALAEQHFQGFTERYLACLNQVADQSIEQRVQALVAVSLELARENPAFSGRLYAELGNFGGIDPVRASREPIIEVLTQAFATLPDNRRPQQPEMLAFIVTYACGQVIGEAAISRPQWLRDEAFEAQINQLVMGYYQRSGLL